MEPFTVTPTKKLITVAALLEFLLLLALVVFYLYYLPESNRNLALVVAPFMLFGLVQAFLIFRAQSTRMTVTSEQLTLERGMGQKTRQMINLDKVQDITVEQSVFQRMLGIGTILIQSAGTGAGVRLESIDSPAEVADRVLKYARQARS